MNEPTKEKLFTIDKEHCAWLKWIYGIDTVKVVFTVRCPNENWNYFLPTGIDIHSVNQQYKHQTPIVNCEHLGGKTCYCDGTSLGAESLWRKFIEQDCNEEIIWEELVIWFNQRNNKQ